MISHWDARMIELARLVATWSRDPSTQVGAVIMRPDKTVASLGFNGLPRGVEDSSERLHDRPTKHAMVVHAEQNALAHAHEPVAGYTLYVTPLYPCSTCAGVVIQHGIARVVYELARDEGDWQGSGRVGIEMMREAGVAIEQFTEDD